MGSAPKPLIHAELVHTMARQKTLLPIGCRILAVGEGDFTFSESLSKKRSPLASGELVATCYDDEAETRARYVACGEGRLDRMRAAGVQVVCGVDATQLGSESCPLQGVAPFDRIVFNFPLLPVSSNQPRDGTADMCVANRAMLVAFLRSAEYLLRPEGRVIIASKDLYPYSWWRIEALPQWAGGDLKLLEMLPWEFTEWPTLYQGPCNVNRDAAVKATDGIMFIFGRRLEGEQNSIANISPEFEWRLGGGSGIRLATPAGSFRCDVCRLDGMSSEKDLAAHKAGKIHRKREDLEKRWETAFAAMQLPRRRLSPAVTAKQSFNKNFFAALSRICTQLCCGIRYS
mmetsp:Transcript_62778/g.99539  ORF Transcript_62778/g.99539 Transcript_62778/m.99539 type:complete len:344 (-) Transcript_62778:89-1120(-)